MQLPSWQVCLVQLFTRNASFSLVRGEQSRANKAWRTYNEDLQVPWRTLQAVIEEGLREATPSIPASGAEQPLRGCKVSCVEFTADLLGPPYVFRSCNEIEWPSIARGGPRKHPQRDGELPNRGGLFEDVHQ